ncbi:hypothetical protein GWI33_006504 [Rhynchophorus ferrugineus]|uniref:Uncharacterized protein n=1 Tax=Rhynchophorus ferrugineus TaxID=354439 RepID=A0A834MDP7_RHYFE|nr:hypothetical protein GWI33_006504 [Rhynchophorus ferrugineus]
MGGAGDRPLPRPLVTHRPNFGNFGLVMARHTTTRHNRSECPDDGAWAKGSWETRHGKYGRLLTIQLQRRERRQVAGCCPTARHALYPFVCPSACSAGARGKTVAAAGSLFLSRGGPPGPPTPPML